MFLQKQRVSTDLYVFMMILNVLVDGVHYFKVTALFLEIDLTEYNASVFSNVNVCDVKKSLTGETVREREMIGFVTLA